MAVSASTRGAKNDVDKPGLAKKLSQDKKKLSHACPGGCPTEFFAPFRRKVVFWDKWDNSSL
jgi:hypothetical protein